MSKAISNAIRKLPIGIQNFEKLRQENFIYIDKTEYIYKLAQNGSQYFLSRPRRFGKSLLLSAMASYWEGKKELFEGLALEELEGNEERSWETYPVFYFDFNGKNYQEKLDYVDYNGSRIEGRKGKLEEKIDEMLRAWEEVYGSKYENRSLEERFEKLLSMAHEKTGKRCVVLVDEYDKPLLDVMEDKELEEHNKAVFKGFFSLLKSSDKDIHFVFITGVTKFNKVSIFSDLNNLDDISLDDDYSGICGITEDELTKNLGPELKALMDRLKLDEEGCLTRLKKAYDGYHFSGGGEGVYNPYSLLSAFRKRKLGRYWFETGTPTFLVKRLRLMNYDVRQFTNESLFATEQRISDYRAGEIKDKGEGAADRSPKNEDVVPLLYQTGYLTIENYNESKDYYTLGFPNEEVKYGFLYSLIPEYSPAVNSESGKDIISISKYLNEGDLEKVKNALIALYAGITYTSQEGTYEHYFQIVIYLVFELLNQYVRTEVQSALGRSDCIVETDRFVYIFEFKRDGSAEEALRQINTKAYARTYASDRRILYKIGVNFDSTIRNISEWKVES